MALWDDLPNASRINAILAHLKANPQKWDAARDAAWDAAWDAARGAARDAAWDAARDAARGAARGAARDAARDAARGAARGAAWDASAALIAWDECVTILDMEPNAVKLLASCGNHAAILLYPAVLAMQSDKEEVC